MKKEFIKKIEIIGLEIDKNNGKLPVKYYPIIDILKVVLQVAKVFTPDNVDKIIDKIIKAIEVFENE